MLPVGRVELLPEVLSECRGDRQLSPEGKARNAYLGTTKMMHEGRHRHFRVITRLGSPSTGGRAGGLLETTGHGENHNPKQTNCREQIRLADNVKSKRRRQKTKTKKTVHGSLES